MFLNPMQAEPTPRASFERPIDLVHLSRQTLGDRALETEILTLFVVQARTLVERIGAADDGQARSDLAHTLKGSARAVGAFRVAEAAEACEVVAFAADAAWNGAATALAEAVREASGAIAELRRAA